MTRANRSLIDRVSGMASVAHCLEAYLWGDPHSVDDNTKKNVAENVVALMADELELLITEVNDDHIMPVPVPQPEQPTAPKRARRNVRR